MVYSVPQQTYNEKGVEGLPQSMSRLNTAWYTTGNSGAGTTSGTLKLPRESTYIERALPPDQRTEAIATKTAALWKSNPANAMQLPDAMLFADESGDGLIDREEFKMLMEKAGAVGDVSKLFAEIDDGGARDRDTWRALSVPRALSPSTTRGAGSSHAKQPNATRMVFAFCSQMVF